MGWWNKIFNKSGASKSSRSPAHNGNLNAEVLIASIAEGVVVIDNDSNIEVFNSSAGLITGWEPNEAIGIDFRSVMPLFDDEGEPLDDSLSPFRKTLKTGTASSFSHGKLQNKAQKFIDIDIVTSPVKNEDGSVSAVIGIFRDVSKERSEEKQRAEFISTASHEMRTPVAAIEGYLALALNDKVCKVDSAARGYLEKAHVSTQHLGKLFQDLLTAAKSEDGRLTNHPEVVEVGQYLDEIIEGVRFTAEKKGLLLESDFSSGAAQTSNTAAAGTAVIRPVAYVQVDPERIREVITNLFDNAVKYTDQGKITIGMSTTENDVLIRVQDTGAGIPKADIPHLFQKFYRVDNSATRQIGGTGLGLFICRKIVELYDGKIWAESQEDKGSIFYVQLPRLSPEKAKQLIAQQSSTIGPISPSTPGTQTVPSTVTQEAPH